MIVSVRSLGPGPPVGGGGQPPQTQASCHVQPMRQVSQLVDRPGPRIAQQDEVVRELPEGRARGGCESGSGEQRVSQETGRQTETQAGKRPSQGGGGEGLGPKKGPGCPQGTAHGQSKRPRRGVTQTPLLQPLLSPEGFSSCHLLWGHCPCLSYSLLLLSASDIY